MAFGSDRPGSRRMLLLTAMVLSALLWLAGSVLPAAAAGGSSSGGQSSGAVSHSSGGGGAWWSALDGRVYNFKDTNVRFFMKGGKLATDWEYMMGAGYPVEPVKFKSPRRCLAVFEFDCGLLKLKFTPDLSVFTVGTDLWETGSHCETITGEGRLKTRR